MLLLAYRNEYFTVNIGHFLCMVYVVFSSIFVLKYIEDTIW